MHLTATSRTEKLLENEIWHQKICWKGKLMNQSPSKVRTSALQKALLWEGKDRRDWGKNVCKAQGIKALYPEHIKESHCSITGTT